VDGNDVFAVREVVSEALETARRGGGPCLIETLTYRLSDHTTADDASRYRSDTEVKEAWAVEPLIRVREYLVNAGAWNDAKEQSLLQDCARQVDAAVSEYLHSVKPSTDAMFDHLFAALPPHLEEQRATARTYSSSDEQPGASKPSGH
jgi:pyruvate dehydrogenase E1 component alpha subunit